LLKLIFIKARRFRSHISVDASDQHTAPHLCRRAAASASMGPPKNVPKAPAAAQPHLVPSAAALREAEASNVDGNSAFMEGGVAEALAYYTAAAVLSGGSVAKYFGNRAQARLRAGALEEARDDAAAAVRLEPASLKFNFRHAKALMQLGQLREAKDVLDRVIATDASARGNPDVVALLATIANGSGAAALAAPAGRSEEGTAKGSKKSKKQREQEAAKPSSTPTAAPRGPGPEMAASKKASAADAAGAGDVPPLDDVNAPPPKGVKPASKPASKPAAKPSAKPANKTAAQPSGEAAAEVSDSDVNDLPALEDIDAAPPKPVPAVTETAATTAPAPAKPAPSGAAKPAAKATAKPAAKPLEKPSAKVAKTKSETSESDSDPPPLEDIDALVPKPTKAAAKSKERGPVSKQPVAKARAVAAVVAATEASGSDSDLPALEDINAPDASAKSTGKPAAQDDPSQLGAKPATKPPGKAAPAPRDDSDVPPLEDIDAPLFTK
jgi:hypothetical protein